MYFQVRYDLDDKKNRPIVAASSGVHDDTVEFRLEPEGAEITFTLRREEAKKLAFVALLKLAGESEATFCYGKFHTGGVSCPEGKVLRQFNDVIARLKKSLASTDSAQSASA